MIEVQILDDNKQIVFKGIVNTKAPFTFWIQTKEDGTHSFNVKGAIMNKGREPLPGGSTATGTSEADEVLRAYDELG